MAMIVHIQSVVKTLVAFCCIFVIGTHGAAATVRAETSADSQPLVDLVTEFLKSANHSVFVSFTRHWIYPDNTIAETDVILKNGVIGKFIPLDNDYYAFMRNDPYFLIAHSVSNSILSPNDFLKADSLEGFDGEYYWFLSLNKPDRSVYETKDGTQQSTFSFNRLALFPAKEAERNSGDPAMDGQLMSQLGLVSEFSSVAQLGYPELLEPQILHSGDSLTMQPRLGRKISAKIIGKQNRPNRIEYTLNDPRIGLASDLDYSQNTITVSRTIEGRKVFAAKYNILSMSLPDKKPDTNMFSWRRYKDAAGDLACTMSENNSTYEVKILPSGTIKPGIAPIHQRTNSPQSQKIVLGAFLILSLSVPLLIKWATKLKNKTQ